MTSTITTSIPPDWSAADMQNHLGGIPLERIRMVPPPGTATEDDVLFVQSRTGRICELIDGVLVEKTMGYYESLVAATLIHFLNAFLDERDLGIVLGEAGTLRILPDQVRIPDVAFLSWEKFPGRKLPEKPIPALAPDLAVEVLSPQNTPREMHRKLEEYFEAGVRLVWYIEPKTKTGRAYTSLQACDEIDQNGVLTGRDVLPGFELRLSDLFARAEGRAGQ